MAAAPVDGERTSVPAQASPPEHERSRLAFVTHIFPGAPELKSVVARRSVLGASGAANGDAGGKAGGDASGGAGGDASGEVSAEAGEAGGKGKRPDRRRRKRRGGRRGWRPSKRRSNAASGKAGCEAGAETSGEAVGNADDSSCEAGGDASEASGGAAGAVSREAGGEADGDASGKAGGGSQTWPRSPKGGGDAQKRTESASLLFRLWMRRGRSLTSRSDASPSGVRGHVPDPAHRPSDPPQNWWNPRSGPSRSRLPSVELRSCNKIGDTDIDVVCICACACACE